MYNDRRDRIVPLRHDENAPRDEERRKNQTLGQNQVLYQVDMVDEGYISPTETGGDYYTMDIALVKMGMTLPLTTKHEKDSRHPTQEAIRGRFLHKERRNIEPGLEWDALRE